MKRFMIKFITTMIFFFYYNANVYSQKIFIDKESRDTFVVISPKDVNLINCIVFDLEYKSKLVKLQDSIIKNDRQLILYKDSIILKSSELLEEKENYYKSSISKLEKSIEQEKKKRKWETGILGGVAAILGILFLVK